ncbi:MAG: YlxR family protein [Candidatus Eremiobacteraeota bacterium]|nr:YlxR family protein [Candidatus Eremiobacteraeota bacterium]
MFPKLELIRLIKNNKGIIEPDEKSIKSGKGIYICKNRDCIKSLLNEKRFRKIYHGSLNGEAFKLLADLSQTFSIT